MMEERIFALDIGTRSVTGILLEKQSDRFSIIDFYTKEHKERSMRDGQIHNVIEVADVIHDVKQQLEQTYGELPSVCVAAAGRALKTVQATAELDLNQQPIAENNIIKHLELSAVQAAQRQLANNENDGDYTNYYCVGYSVLHYKLDGEVIGSLIDQSGKKAAAEIIATFLPKVVVESLLAALSRAELEMEALTLEPIAAIHVLIPESMRRLNVALVDIGAGTSDIAITDKGTVVAYGMVPVAGDEITEAISDYYLLDFPEAEQTKKEILLNGKDTVQDILGFETTIDHTTLMHDITSDVERLAGAIAEEIIQLNSRAPKAVMLVGGGSLTPGINTALAKKLQLPANRVAVRGIDAIQHITKTEQLPTGPDYVTPIGIAIAAIENPVHYVSISVNNQTIRLFEMKQLTIGDCLVQAGIEINKWYGRPGVAAIVTVNDKTVTLPGEYGKAPVVQLNNSPANVDTIVHHGDSISLVKGVDGKEPTVTLEELVGEVSSFTIYFNDTAYQITTTFYVNGVRQEKDYILQDNDSIEWNQTRTVQDFIETLAPEKRKTVQAFHVYVNNKEVILQNTGGTQLYLNNEKAIINQPLKNGDHITIKTRKHPTVNDILNQCHEVLWDSITVTFNNKPVLVKQQFNKVYRNQEELSEDTLLMPNDKLEVRRQTVTPYIFQDIFRYIEIDLANASGNFKLYKNKQPATFHETIHDGDNLELIWED